MNKHEIKQFVEQNPNLVSMRESERYPGLFVLKYKNRVFYDNLWNDYLEECRGTAVDADFNVVARPFTKIYNYGVEAKAPVLQSGTMVDAYRKVNGFMCAITPYKGKLLVSTTGSLDSPFVDMAREMLAANEKRISQHIFKCTPQTWMFECVHPNDPHIVYEKPGLYLIGTRNLDWSAMEMTPPEVLQYHAECMGLEPVEHLRVSIDDLQALAKQVCHEGFVFYTDTGVSAKIKSPHYLSLKAMARRADILSLDKRRVDEEYYPLLEQLQGMGEQFNAMPEQERLRFIKAAIFRA